MEDMSRHVSGSVLRDDFGPDSDVDALVEFQAGHVPGFNFVSIEREFSELLHGRRVDMVTYIRAADSDPSWQANVPKVAAEIHQIFSDEELHSYFATATRIGVTGHVCTEEQYETMRDAGAFDEDVVTDAADALLFERARALLFGGATSDDLR
jgi:nucleotidyltransferase-like protein